MNKLSWALGAVIVVQLIGCSTTQKTQLSSSSSASSSSGDPIRSPAPFDENRDGVLELNEVQDQVGAAFERADKDHNHVLSGAEIGSLSKLDLNKDGSISILEAMDGAEKQFSDADKSHRGFLDSNQSSQLSFAK